jgi:hypothetical protein
MNGLVSLLNSKRGVDLPALDNHVGWVQKGPLAMDRVSTPAESDDDHAHDRSKPQSRHLAKFKQCGARCFTLARAYYAQDFETLKYPQTSADVQR